MPRSGRDTESCRTLVCVASAKMNLANDPNLVRHDMWFGYPEDVVPFLQNLLQDHPGVDPKLVSAALMQARKNLVVGPKRDCLKREVSRLLQLPQYWTLTAC